MTNKKAVILTIILAIITIFLSLSIRHSREIQRELDKELKITAQKLEAKRTYDYCIQDSYDTYILDWNGQCEVDGKKEDCYLTTSQADLLSERREGNEKTCLDIYKAELSAI